MKMKKAKIQLETLTCPSCTQKVEAAVGGVEGVDKETIKVRFNSSSVTLNFDDEKSSIEDIEEVIQKVGYEVEKSRVK